MFAPLRGGKKYHEATTPHVVTCEIMRKVSWPQKSLRGARWLRSVERARLDGESMADDSAERLPQSCLLATMGKGHFISRPHP